MMKKTLTADRTVFLKIIAVLLVIASVVCAFDINVSAAAPKLSSASMTVAVGETRTLKLKNADGDVKWSTSDKTIATVSGGKVTGKKTGTVTVSAKYDSKTYKCKITVKPYRLYAKTTKMDVGDTQTLKLRGNTDGKTIKWSSSDKSVLTVNSKGKVTAKGAGTAIIYAKIGNKKYGKKITVSPVFRDTGEEFNIYTWNSEFVDIFEQYYPGYEKTDDYGGYIGDVRVNFIINYAADDEYEKALDKSLTGTNKNNPVDIFLVEDMNAEKYFASPYVMNLSDIGITDEDTKYMYQVTKDIGSYEGELKAAAWQVCPGGFVYRRSIAKKVLGTDDPEKVQEYLSSWTKFETTAKKMKKKGYYMVSNTDVMAKPFFYNEDDRFVSGNELKLSDNMRDWLAISKRFYDNGYCSGSMTWSYEWCEEQAEGGNVFGFFYSTWGVDYTLPGNSMAYDYITGEYSKEGLYGDWALVEGPENYIWGGSYICVSENCDNTDLAADIIRKLCCDYSTMMKMTEDEYNTIYPNNSKVLKKMAKKDIENDFLGGQNTYEIFADIAKGCRAKGGVGMYDSYVFYEYLYMFDDYFKGYISYEDVMNTYYYIMSDTYPELYVPDKIPSEPE